VPALGALARLRVLELSCSTLKLLASAAVPVTIRCLRISFSAMLLLPFLVIKARPLRAIARWPHARVNRVAQGMKRGMSVATNCVEPDVHRDALANFPRGAFG
jgi:hypothetical protein